MTFTTTIDFTASGGSLAVGHDATRVARVRLAKLWRPSWARRVCAANPQLTRPLETTGWPVRDQAGWVLGFAFGEEGELCARVSQPSGRLPLPGQLILRAST